MKFAHTKHGLVADPRGAQVRLDFAGRTLLGDVIGATRNEVTGAIELNVRHFNGEPWPIRPTSRAVDVISPRMVEYACEDCGATGELFDHWIGDDFVKLCRTCSR